MTGLQAVGFLLLTSLASGSSTCQRQSAAGEVSSKDSTPPAEVTLQGVDTSALTPRERKEWSAYVSELLAPCSDVPVSISQCVQEKRACAKCLPAAKYLLKGVRDGMSRDQVEKSFHNRFDADRVRNVALDGSPSKGPDSAPITVVEFADFECPFCAMMAPVIESVVAERPQQVRFVFKFMPLPAHPHGESAARAALAALPQGKFWDMHHKLFENRDHLEQSDVDAYAKELGLDLSRFHADMQSTATNERLARDRQLADSLDVKATPTIYINGREYSAHQDMKQDLNEWLNLELISLGVSSASKGSGGKAEVAPLAPAASASSAAAASPSPAGSSRGAKQR